MEEREAVEDPDSWRGRHHRCLPLASPEQWVGLCSWQPIPVMTPCQASRRTFGPTRGTSADSATLLREESGKVRRDWGRATRKKEDSDNGASPRHKGGCCNNDNETSGTSTPTARTACGHQRRRRSQIRSRSRPTLSPLCSSPEPRSSRRNRPRRHARLRDGLLGRALPSHQRSDPGGGGTARSDACLRRQSRHGRPR